MVDSESKMNYKHFIKYIDEILANTILFFQEQFGLKCKKEDMAIKLRIYFNDEYKNVETMCKNPFWNKLFKDFDDKITEYTLLM